MVWKTGQSGNPAGRKANPISERFRQATESQMDAVIEAMVTAAKAGDTSAAKLLIDRCIPPFKPVQPASAFPLSGDSLVEKAEAILAAVANGALAVHDAKALIDAIGSLARIIEVEEFERRIAVLEGKL